MPQRFLRPGIRNSAIWNRVSFPCQSFYIRILTLVDDFGCYDGRASVLWGECFSVWNQLHPADCCDLQQTAQLLQQLAAASLVNLYESEGKSVLQVTQWQERVREGSKRKWPLPQQSAAIRSVLLPPSSPSPPSPSSPPAPAPSDARAHGGELQEVAANPIVDTPVVRSEDWPTLETVLGIADIRGIPRECAEKWWSERDSAGGVDRNGQPILNWESSLRGYWVGWQATQALRSGGRAIPGSGEVRQKPSSTYELTKALEMKQERLKEMRFQHGFEEPDGTFRWDNPQNLAAAKALKTEIKDLKAKIEANVK